MLHHPSLRSFTMTLATMFCFFFFNDTATTEIYTLSLHDALPISAPARRAGPGRRPPPAPRPWRRTARSATACRCAGTPPRSEEHTSELPSQSNLVCRLLLEKKKTTQHSVHSSYISHQVTKHHAAS